MGLAEHTEDWYPFLATVGFYTHVEGRHDTGDTKTGSQGSQGQRDV